MTPLSVTAKIALILVSFGLVAFGQPAWVWWFGLLASMLGFSLFWRVLLSVERPSHRFWGAMGWYTAVQIVQLSWVTSHPYSYIYAVLLLLASLMGAQCGWIALWIVPASFKKWSTLAALAGLWTLLEWSRLFILSGLSFGPAGLALTGSLYTLQMATIGGVYFLSFWVILTNLAVLRTWIFDFRRSDLVFTFVLVFFPYLFGFVHDQFHEAKAKTSSTLAVLLVQPGLESEEGIHFQSAEEARAFVLDEWKTILGTTSKYLKERVDLIVLPEYVVPYGTFHPVFPHEAIKKLFLDLYGPLDDKIFPPLNRLLAGHIETERGFQWLVSNGYIVQTLANLFQADLVVGLEDSVYVDEAAKKREAYSAAFHFKPGNKAPKRYEKQILLPMGEYIPFEWCRALAAKYGISGSFTAGKEAKVFDGPVPFSPSICYEETFGHLMRYNRLKGAQLLVNLTNDGWYPHSLLPQQHFDLSRLRTVECGIPLVRACNTGLTGACDSLGRIVGLLEIHDETGEHLTGAIKLDVPTYHYQTLYMIWGDYFVLSLCGITLYALFRKKDQD